METCLKCNRALGPDKVLLPVDWRPPSILYSQSSLCGQTYSITAPQNPLQSESEQQGAHSPESYSYWDKGALCSVQCAFDYARSTLSLDHNLSLPLLYKLYGGAF